MERSYDEKSNKLDGGSFKAVKSRTGPKVQAMLLDRGKQFVPSGSEKPGSPERAERPGGRNLKKALTNQKGENRPEPVLRTGRRVSSDPRRDEEEKRRESPEKGSGRISAESPNRAAPASLVVCTWNSQGRDGFKAAALSQYLQKNEEIKIVMLQETSAPSQEWSLEQCSLRTSPYNLKVSLKWGTHIFGNKRTSPGKFFVLWYNPATADEAGHARCSMAVLVRLDCLDDDFFEKFKRQRQRAETDPAGDQPEEVSGFEDTQVKDKHKPATAPEAQPDMKAAEKQEGALSLADDDVVCVLRSRYDRLRPFIGVRLKGGYWALNAHCPSTSNKFPALITALVLGQIHFRRNYFTVGDYNHEPEGLSRYIKDKTGLRGLHIVHSGPSHSAAPGGPLERTLDYLCTNIAQEPKGLLTWEVRDLVEDKLTLLSDHLPKVFKVRLGERGSLPGPDAGLGRRPR